jgi:REP element-mobilizing transposase RayT
MARKPRIEFPGAFFHVITRGNNRQKIFLDDKDYKIFLDRLNLYKERFKFVIYAYVLMPNHVHMLIETGEAPLSRIMQALQFTYTQKFNRRHRKVGHLFQGRYKAILCQKETYLLELIRYIVLNPIRARLVKKPADWRWCSFADLFQPENEHIVSVDEVLRMFGKQRGMAVKNLQKYINDGLANGHNESYYKLKDQRILGEDDFADEVVKTGEIKAGDFEYYNIDIGGMAALVAKHMNIKMEQINSVTRERVGAKARGVVTYICKAFGGKTVKDVSAYFCKDNAVLSRMMKRIEQENVENEDFRKLMQRIETDIKSNYRPCIVREVKPNKSNKQA